MSDIEQLVLSQEQIKQIAAQIATGKQTGPSKIGAAAGYILARFSEPSSYAGLGAMLAMVGWNLPAEYYPEIAQAGAGICALAAVALKDRSAAVQDKGAGA